jgi:hypothetical protein
MLKFLAGLLTLSAILGGCAGGEKSAIMQAQTEDDQACQFSGASPGTRVYSKCRARLAQQWATSQTQMQESKQRDITPKIGSVPQ